MLIKYLHDLSRKINSQDHRATFMPLFVVQEKKTRICHDSQSDYDQYYDDEFNEILESELCEDCASKDVYSKDQPCEKCGYFQTLPVVEEWVFNLDHGVFLTAEECENYIKSRRYALADEVRSFAISAFRNEELKNVLHYISSLTNNGQPHQNYKSF